MKNFLAVTLISLGVPMILMGDEVRRTQGGNNNAYCHDDETAWFDWTLLDRHADVRRFVELLNARRLLRDIGHERQRMSLNQLIREAAKSWHGVRLNEPDWSDHSHSVAFTVEIRAHGPLFHVIMNAYWEPLSFELPPGGGQGTLPWRRWIDTALPAPQDIVPWEEAPEVTGRTYPAGSRSVVVLYSPTRPDLPPGSSARDATTDATYD